MPKESGGSRHGEHSMGRRASLEMAGGSCLGSDPWSRWWLATTFPLVDAMEGLEIDGGSGNPPRSVVCGLFPLAARLGG
jgi:hypothetical protein